MVGDSYKKTKGSGKTPRRITTMIVVCFLFVGIIAVRMFFLQVLDHDYYTALASDQHQLTKELIPQRGNIYLADAAGTRFPLALNRSLYMIYAVPSLVQNADETTKKVASILGVPTPDERKKAEDAAKAAAAKNPKDKPEDQGVILNSNVVTDQVTVTYETLQQKISKQKDNYEILAHKITKEKADAIVAAKLPGIRTQEEEWRYYPENSLASQIIGYLGFTNDKQVGSYGIEGYFNDLLTGKPGYLQGEQDTQGRLLITGQKKLVPAEQGSSIVLTLDRTVQYIAEKYAKEAVDRTKAEKSSIIIMDPDNGKVLGMANYPTYDVNQYSKVSSPNLYNNNAIFETFEPGSIFKPIVMAAGIDSGAVTPDTTYINTGSVKVDNFTIHNVVQRAAGPTTMTEALDWSLNTGLVYVTSQLGKDRLYEYLKKFGFDELTGIQLATEGTTLLSDPSTWSKAKLATLGFGQGVATTSMHMVAASAAVVNGGKLFEPQIVSEIDHPDGTVEKISPKEIRQVISPTTSETMRAMLTDGAVHGLAHAAAVPGYSFGGKTGTAQVAVNGSYDNNHRITTFVGFAPANHPRFVAMVKISNPQTGIYSETTSVPIYKDLSKELYSYFKMAPDL
jgi:cell division protein FtsI/penicillin-binding protein 2